MRAIAVLLFLLFGANALADQVHLKSGGTLLGIAREEGDRIVVELKIGTAVFPKSAVSRIVLGHMVAIHEMSDMELMQRLHEVMKKLGIDADRLPDMRKLPELTNGEVDAGD